MKKIRTLTMLIIALFSVNLGISQNLNNSKQAINELLGTGYTFSYTTGTYTNLVGSTILTTDIWDDFLYPCPIGFTFKFYNIPIDTLNFSDPNTVTFGNNLGKYVVSAFGADMSDRGRGDGTFKPKSPISYLLDGTAPNRILKIEWKNAGFILEIDDSNILNKTNFINLQLWLYETSDLIEIHFGSHKVTYPGIIYEGTSGPNVSLNNNVNSKYVSLIGDSTKPTVSSVPEVRMNGTPPNGMIFKFASNYVGIADNSNGKYSIYPNPVKDVFHVMLPKKYEWVNVQIVNLLGNEMLNQKFTNSEQISLNISTLARGTYLMKLQTAGTVITRKITKQ
jgi:hypothetical protein